VTKKKSAEFNCRGIAAAALRNVSARVMFVVLLSGSSLAVAAPACTESNADSLSHEPCIAVPQGSVDERILATLNFPSTHLIYYRVSDDGRYLYIVTADPKYVPSSARKDRVARLAVYDMLLPTSPRQLSSIDLGEGGIDQFIVRGNVAFITRSRDLESDPGSYFLVVDLSDPAKPRLAGRYDSPVGSFFSSALVSSDGKTVALSPASPNQQHDTMFVQLNASGQPEARNDLSDGIRSFAPTIGLNWSFEHDADTVQPMQASGVFVTESYTDAHDVIIFTTHAPAFDASRLRAAYDAVTQDYQDCVTKQPSALCQVDTGRLAFAGMQTLLSTLPAGISTGERVVMLNDYGFWLAHERYFDRAVPVLEQVTHLAPAREIAWLNLGDAARQALLVANSDSQKAMYWSKAQSAYARYTTLTGKIPDTAARLGRFDLPQARSTAANICDYVAQAFSAENGDEISTTEGNVRHDGRPVAFYVARNEGSCSTKSIQLHDGNEDKIGRDTPSEFQADAPETNEGVRDMRIVPFRGKSYVLSLIDNGPYDVVAPYGGHVCKFTRSFTPALVENTSGPLCKAFLDTSKAVPQSWSHDNVSAIATALIDNPAVVPNQGVFDGMASADLSGKGHAIRLGHYTSEWTGGCGCGRGGIAILDGNAMDTGPINKTLLDAQRLGYEDWSERWAGCRSSDSDLVSLEGRTYIEQHSGNYELQGHPASRSLIGLEGDRFKRICRIDQMPTYRGISLSEKQ
jgi:hypothetical protein